MSSPDEKSTFRISETSAFTRLSSASSPNARSYRPGPSPFDFFSPSRPSPPRQGLRQPARSGRSGSNTGSESISGSGKVCRPVPLRNSPMSVPPRQSSSSTLRGPSLHRGPSNTSSMYRKFDDPSPQSSGLPASYVADSFSADTTPMNILPLSFDLPERQNSEQARSSLSEHVHPAGLAPLSRDPRIGQRSQFCTHRKTKPARDPSWSPSDRTENDPERGTRVSGKKNASLKTRVGSGTTKGASRSRKQSTQAPAAAATSVPDEFLPPPGTTRHAMTDARTTNPSRATLIGQMAGTHESRESARMLLKHAYPKVSEAGLLRMTPEEVQGHRLRDLRDRLEKAEWDDNFWRMEWTRMKYGPLPRDIFE